MADQRLDAVAAGQHNRLARAVCRANQSGEQVDRHRRHVGRAHENIAVALERIDQTGERSGKWRAVGFSHERCGRIASLRDHRVRPRRRQGVGNPQRQRSSHQLQVGLVAAHARRSAAAQHDAGRPHA